MLQRGQAADAAGAAELSNEGPVSVMTFGLLDFWRFSPVPQVIFGQ